MIARLIETWIVRHAITRRVATMTVVVMTGRAVDMTTAVVMIIGVDTAVIDDVTMGIGVNALRRVVTTVRRG